MKDIFGNKKPVEVMEGEWWFNGRIIQRQGHPKLPKYISFEDIDESKTATPHNSKGEAIKYCLNNPCKEPDHQPKDYL